jgi:hypothetical protein
MPPAALSHDADKPSRELSSDLAQATNEASEKEQEDLAPLSACGV